MAWAVSTSVSSEDRALARRLFDSARDHRAITRLTAEREFGEREAYGIQWALVEEYLERGARVIGTKTGLTSKAKQVQMNTDEPLYAYLLDRTILTDGAAIQRSELIHPRVEAEIAFVMDHDLEGSDVTGDQVLRATRYVMPALEVIDSRYENFQFTLPDVIADQASAALVVVGGSARSPKDLDLRLLGMLLEINGEIQA